mmetsp:Transcript_9003/g.12809  ORF Transcript_9003/g.12809 Transcript_9003/m.12809 type:complete len:777 (+) Transcript_9003:275-2605(+)
MSLSSSMLPSSDIDEMELNNPWSTKMPEQQEQRGLKFGKFVFDEKPSDTVGDFVYVPLGYDFTTENGFNDLLKAANLPFDVPNMVFQFEKNHGVVPNKDTRDIELHRKLSNLQDSNNTDFYNSRADLCFPDPKRDYFAIKEMETRVKNFLNGLSDACSQAQALFLINEPFKGNILAELACVSAAEYGVTSLGLFSCRHEGCGGFSVIDETKAEDRTSFDFDYESEASIPWHERLDKRRSHIPAEIFDDSAYLAAQGEIPKHFIKISCNLTEIEKKFFETFRLSMVGGGLANKCTHRIVFENDCQKNKFRDMFINKFPTGFLVTGSSKDALLSAITTLKTGRPLFVLKGSGLASNVVAKLITLGDKLETGVLSNRYKIANYVENNFPPLGNEAMIMDMNDNLWKEGKVIAQSFTSFSQNFDKDSHQVFNLETQVDIVNIQNLITLSMSSVYDNIPELGRKFKDTQVIRRIHRLKQLLRLAKCRCRRHADVMQFLIRAMFLAVNALTIIKTTTTTADTTAHRVLLIINVVLPIIASVFLSVWSFTRPNEKFVTLLLAEERIRSEELRFRTRTGQYRPVSSHNSNKQRIRAIFASQCQELFEACIRSHLSSDSFLNKSQWNESDEHEFPWGEDIDEDIDKEDLELRLSDSVTHSNPSSPHQTSSMNSAGVFDDSSQMNIERDDQCDVKLQSHGLRQEIPQVMLEEDNFGRWDAVIKPERYIKERLKPSLLKFHNELPRISLLYKTLKILSIAAIAFTTVIVSFGAEAWAPMLLAGSASF